MNAELAELAKAIHDIVCDEGKFCKRYKNTEDPHYKFYQERAQSLTKRLDSLTTAKNTVEIVTIVMDELL